MCRPTTTEPMHPKIRRFTRDCAHEEFESSCRLYDMRSHNPSLSFPHIPAGIVVSTPFLSYLALKNV